MGKSIITLVYIGAVLVAAVLVAAVSTTLWPVRWDVSPALVMLLVASLVFLAARYPFKLSPQADASLFTVPLLMGVLLLHPLEAAISGTAGYFLAELMQRRPMKAVVFNAGVSMSGIVFWALRPTASELSFINPYTLTAVAAAGVTLHFTNLLLVAGIVTIRKGSAFWKQWKETWAIDVVQEGGALILGFVAALLAGVALWTVILLVAPLALAYVAFRRSVDETRRNVELAERNGSLASELKQRLMELEETQTQLIMQSEKLASIGTMAASVVHEVKNAMCVTGGRAELLLRNSELYLRSEKATEHVKTINEMTYRVTDIVQELLAYSRVDTSFKEVSVSKAMNVAVDLIGKKADGKGVNIAEEYGETPAIHGVGNQLQQVFINLLINAIDATPSGGTITLNCASQDGQVVASVKDNGTGISENVLSRMFDPFFTTKEEGEGTGLGMFVCRKIVADHGGEFLVNSEEGVGTEMIIKLPALEVPEKHQPNPSELERAAADIDRVLAEKGRDVVLAATPS